MTVATAIPRGDVTVSLNFYNPPTDNSQPYNNIDPKPDMIPRNYSDVAKETTLHDIRGHESEYSLDRDAFQVLQDVAPSNEPSDFRDDDSIAKHYYTEVEKLLLKTISGATRIHIFDHTIRRSDPGANRAPVNRVHIDQTARSVAKRVRNYFPDEADELLRGRYRIVNVWRPLNKNPVESNPLGFASSSTVVDDDVVPVEHRYPSGYLGETAAIRYNKDQKWHYLSGMTGSERLLLECFDSASLQPGSKIGGRVPHSAFVDPRTREDAEGRESIEVRALVFGQ